MTLIVTFGGGWLWWMVQLTRMANQAVANDKLSDLRDLQISKDIDEIKTKLNSTHTDFHEQLRDVTQKLNMLIGEFQFMRGSMSSQQTKTTE